VVAGMVRQPGPHFGVLVRGIVIHDEVDLEFFWDSGVQPAQEREKLLVAVAGLAFGEDSAGGDIESRK
jgi:hypothetical protein